MRIANDIASWAVEARKYNMSYGQYVQAVNHGELPPPKTKRKPKDEPRKRVCKACGNEFELSKHYRHDGKIYYSEAKYCDSCRINAQCYHRKVVR